MSLDLICLLKWKFPDLNGARARVGVVTDSSKEYLARVVHNDLGDMSVDLWELWLFLGSVKGWSWWDLDGLVFGVDGALVTNGDELIWLAREVSDA